MVDKSISVVQSLTSNCRDCAVVHNAIDVELAMRCRNLQKPTATWSRSTAVVRGRSRRVLRTARPERRRQDDDNRDPRRAAQPDAGDVEMLGHYWKTDERQLRQRLGVQLQETQLAEKLTVEETLPAFPIVLPSRQDRRRVAAHSSNSKVEAPELGRQALRRSKAASGSWRARLPAMPDLLFLDEPTTGFDPQSRRQLWAHPRAISRPKAGRWSSRRTTWTRPRRSAIASRSWTMAM